MRLSLSPVIIRAGWQNGWVTLVRSGWSKTRSGRKLSERHTGSGNPMFGVTPTHAKFTDEQVREIRVSISKGDSLNTIAKRYGVSKGTIAHIRQGRSYHLIAHEQHFIDILKPKYNLAPMAGTCLGVKYSPESRARISARVSGEGNYWFGKVPPCATMPRSAEMRVYRLVNILTGECYVGSSTNLGNRLAVHRYQMTNGTHGNRNVQAAFDEHGISAFSFEVLKIVADKSHIT
ncbi:hypothetical protein CRX72_19015 [Pantoea sp. BRM17]|nr:hypothetical protein CRX72_19015 [Pantoea sp. BRM17]